MQGLGPSTEPATLTNRKSKSYYWAVWVLGSSAQEVHEGISTRGICSYCCAFKRRRGGELARLTTARILEHKHGILANMLSALNDACPCKAERVQILEGQDEELPL